MPVLPLQGAVRWEALGGAFPGRWDALAHSAETESGHACRFFLGAARRERAQQKPQGQGRLAGAYHHWICSFHCWVNNLEDSGCGLATAMYFCINLDEADVCLSK